MDRVTWSRISSWTLGIGGSFGEEIARCYSHAGYAEVSDVGANALISQ
jgi:hypothetical protein